MTLSAEHRKPLIALIIDSESWAFANIAKQIVEKLSQKYEFRVIPTEVIPNINQVLIMTEDCDIVHFFWRESINLANSEYFSTYARSLGCSAEGFKERFIYSRVITSSVYDHLFLSDKEISDREWLYNRTLAGYTVCSEKLLQIYSNIPTYPAPSQLAQDGVDLTVFRPRNLSRFNELGSRALRIGWVGNSKWAAEKEDVKGLLSIIKPAIAQLQHEGLLIETYFADRQEAFIPHSEMPDYYAKLDVYVCASKIEGTPNPVLEAMACGVPIITTDVGVVSEVLGTEQRKLIVQDRSVDAFKSKIREVYERRESWLVQLSAENLNAITPWNWSEKVNNFDRFFERMLGKGKQRGVNRSPHQDA